MDEGLERKIKNDFEKLKDDLEEIEEKHNFLVENLSAKECVEYGPNYNLIKDAAITKAYREYFGISVEEMKSYNLG